MVVWDAVKQEEAFRSDQLCRTPPVYGKKPAQALCMEFSRDGRRLAIGTNVWTTVSIWNTGDWSPFQKPFTTGHGVRDVCFAPGAENLLWSADWQGDCCQFVSPPYYSGPSAGGASRSPPAVRLNVPVADLAVSPDGGLFAAAAWNGTARLFDPDPAKMQEDPAVLEHTGEVTSVDFSPDGKRLLTASTSGEVIIWDRRTRRRMFLWLQTEPVLQAAFATGGSRIVIARMDGMVRVRRVFDGRPLPERAPELLEELQGDGLGPDETPATLTGQGESKK